MNYVSASRHTHTHRIHTVTTAQLPAAWPKFKYYPHLWHLPPLATLGRQLHPLIKYFLAFLRQFRL